MLFLPYRKTCSDVQYAGKRIGYLVKKMKHGSERKNKSFGKKNHKGPLHVCCALTLTAAIVLDIKGRRDGWIDKRNVGRNKGKMRRHECKSTV